MPIATPNLDAFVALQARAMEDAIRRSRARAGAADRLNGMFNRVRTSPSVLEAKIKQWSRGAAAPASMQKAGTLVRPNWTQIRTDLELLAATVGEAIVAAMDARLGAQALRAREEWPVDTGLSRALLYLRIDFAESRITGTLGSGAPYTPYIHPAGVLTKKQEKMVRLAGQETYRDKRGRIRVKGRGTPAWKMAYLRKVGGKWTFDTAAYDAGQAERKYTGAVLTDEGRKPAKNRPFQDLIVKPAKATAQAVGADVVAAVRRD